jgi:hypothetical protein
MSSESLDPDTAPENQSIWNGIDRTVLERHTQALFAKDHVAGRCYYAETSYPKDDRSYPLSLEVEKSLADDFAFIAACQPEANFVSAAAIEQNGSSCSFVVKLAANEGVSLDVRKTFDELFQVLRRHARKGNALFAPGCYEYTLLTSKTSPERTARENFLNSLCS